MTWRKREIAEEAYSNRISMNIYKSETEYLKSEVQKLIALVRAQQITIDKLEAALAQPAPVQEHQINQLEKFKNHVLANANELGVVLDAPAAPVQEPVAWMEALKDAFFEGFTSVETYNDTLLNSAEEAWAKYKPPAALPQRKPLSGEAIYKVAIRATPKQFDGMTYVPEWVIYFARLIEAAHSIKE